ncbi:LOW QUALITY PROTEIN: xyloglucan-specific galacturonosyltransferase 1-like [Phoenix dactylifera]|uniref:LOW QUALITY PROTEIN: xyloglucan-specific galacturonosyltransferase 1-like n=1 Tax=Phoenix dactylifera TaxID=42345 RepID=A0A8B7CE54_PHODC|nr:LOW QUALITY PROTEIN: xyloglucan-specific galacturonosyltransferase 1-like [Phoenix dactylifera]
MALSLMRRRTQASRPVMEKQTLSTTKPRGCLQIPTTFFLFILLSFWCYSLLVTNSFHLCVSSRKVHHYCISGGANPRFDLLEVLDSLNIPTNRNRTIIHNQAGGNRKDEIANAVKVVEEQVQEQRSWASKGMHVETQRSCDNRGIFVYDLPSKFNRDLMAQCRDLLPWTDLCEYFANDAMGQPMPQLGKGWYQTHQYSLEPIFHSRILNHPCRVHDYNNAKLFYVPFYGGLSILRWHFKNVSSDVKDMLGVELVKWLEDQPPWTRSSGKDHMFVLGKISWDFRRNGHNAWGSNFLSLDAMQAPYKFLIERQPWEPNEIGIPHPTYFHPHDDTDIAAWQRRIISSWRRSLVSFAGAARPEAAESIRSVLIGQCVSRSDHCRFLDCATGSCLRWIEAVVSLFMESEFCLQPPGDSPTRKSVFDSLASGCIPVLFSRYTAYYQYTWHLPENHRKYSVFIDEEEVREGKVDVIEKLKEVSLEERHEMRRFIVYELMPGLVYGDSNANFEKFRDAFDIVLDNLVDRVTTRSR